ncbi:hypothetical protein DY000_02022596 [Brassica cretica]|uniref:Uncharacterized protein n=1 Tax=Brassica cretica TaxID=69181 RepID=A0ABQ7EJ52_BRACR|nr:hypothetical protein DY000_02022596 [Brassica cretica]
MADLSLFCRVVTKNNVTHHSDKRSGVSKLKHNSFIRSTCSLQRVANLPIYSCLSLGASAATCFDRGTTLQLYKEGRVTFNHHQKLSFRITKLRLLPITLSHYHQDLVIKGVVDLVEAEIASQSQPLSDDGDSTGASTNLPLLQINEMVEKPVPKRKEGRLVGLARRASSYPAPSSQAPYADPMILEELHDKDERIGALEEQNTTIISENATIRSENATIRSENATIRSENATILAELAS